MAMPLAGVWARFGHQVLGPKRPTLYKMLHVAEPVLLPAVLPAIFGLQNGRPLALSGELPAAATLAA